MRGGRRVTSTLYLRFMRSTVISTCMLPTPEISSCFVSGSNWWWTVGSSSSMRDSALEILSSSPRVLGWIAKLMAGSGNVRRGSSKACASSLRVSPVRVSLSFWATPISPGPRSLTGFCVLPCSHATWPMRSRAPRLGFDSVESAFTVPVITRKSESLPMCGSCSVLNTSATGGCLASTGRAAVCLALTSVPLISPCSAGDGNSCTIRSRSGWLPIDLEAPAQSTGTILPAPMPLLSALSIDASSSAPSSRYLVSRSSSVSAAASTSFSRHSRARSDRSAGMSVSDDLPSASTTRRPARASAMRSPYPGVSTRLTRWPFQSRYAIEVLIEIFRLTSSGSKSVVVLPSSTLPRRVMAPAVNSRASTREVLPTPPWPTTPTLRIFPISIAIRPASWERAVLGRGPMLPHRRRSDAEGAANGRHDRRVRARQVDGGRQRRRVVLDAGAGEDQHDAGVDGDRAALLHLGERGHQRRALRRGPDPFQTAEQPLRILDGRLAPVDRVAACVAQDLQHLAAGERRGPAQARRMRRRILPRGGGRGPVSERLHDRRTALGLDGDDPRERPREPAHRGELLVALGDADEAG